MKNLFLTTILTLIVGAVFAQAYRPMNGYYQYNGNLRFNDSLFLDTASFSSGFMTNDTTGSYLTGYGRLRATSGVGVTNRIAYWGSAADITSSAPFKVIPDSGTLSLAPIGLEAILISGGKKINSGGNVISSIGGFEFESKIGLDIKFSPESDYVMKINKDLITVGTDSNVNFLINADLDTALYVSRALRGAVGVRVNPTNPLHIQAITGNTETAIRIDNPAESNPAAGSLSLNNGPAASAGDPAKWLKINIDGTDYVIALWGI